MRKNVLVTMCLIILFSIYVFAQNTITRDEAFRVLKQKGLVDTLTNNVQVSLQIIQSKTTLPFMLDSIISPESKSWFFLIDLHPGAEWAHPCKYVFVNTTDASLIVINGQLGASFETDYILIQKSGSLPMPAFFKK